MNFSRSHPPKPAGLAMTADPSWHACCDSRSMTNTPPPPTDEVPQSAEAAPQAHQKFHSLQDLPVAVGQVSTGPLGSVARKDHISWKTKRMTEPGYWRGRIDSELGHRLQDRPLPCIAICFGIGALVGMTVSVR